MSTNPARPVTVSYEDLRTLVSDIYRSAGASKEDAELIALRQVGSNLVGYESHGVQLLASYVERVDRGHVMPTATPIVVSETPSSIFVNGQWGFGQVITDWTTRRTIEKARATGIAVASIREQGHVGRLSDYALMAASEGFIAMIMCDSGQAPKQVAPFGGREARLGTNPMCIALPSDLDAPVIVDMATSAVAMAKLKVARSRGETVPLGWLLTKDGDPTTDPNDFFQGGVLLPMGGNEGYKGYGLSVMVETLAAILPGLGYGIDPLGRHNDGLFMMILDPALFRPLDEFKTDVKGFVEFLKDTPTATGFDEVLYPGEIERRMELKRREHGIPVDASTWVELSEVAERFGLTMPTALADAAQG